MREVELLIRGIIVGLMIAMPVGPVNILCIHRTIEGDGSRASSPASERRRPICSTALSRASASHSSSSSLYGNNSGFAFFGGILLVIVGIWYFFKRPESLDAQTQDRASAYSDLRSTFLLTLTNPTTVLSFLAILAALGIGHQRQWWLTVFLVGGIFCGSMLWWIVLGSIVNLFRDRFNDRSLRLMNRFAGLLIVGFGIAAVVLSRTWL